MCVTKNAKAPKKFEAAELQALLGEDLYLSLDRLAKELNVDPLLENIYTQWEWCKKKEMGATQIERK